MSNGQAEDQPSWLPFDLDDVFAYRTPKVVKIRDRRLGCARILIMLAIFVYIVIYEVIIRKGYLLREEPTGGITTSLRRGATSATLPSYCRDGPDGAVNTSLPCWWIDEADVLVPPGEEFSMFISTRVTVVEETLTAGCANQLLYKQNGAAISLVDSVSGSTCTQPERFSVANRRVGKSFYVGDIENFTMLWAHAVYGPASELQQHSTDVNFADLEAANGKVQSFLPRRSGTDAATFLLQNGYVGRTNGDVLTMNTFIQGADLDTPTLDQVSRTSRGVTCPTQVTSPTQCPGTCFWNGPICTATTQAACEATTYENGRCQWNATTTACQARAANYCQLNTIRYDGAVFLVLVQYKTPEYTSASLGYDYKFRWIRKSEYKYIEKIRDGNKVTYYNRHGVRLLFVQTGYMTSFSFQVLLTTLVTAIALLEIANVVVIYLVMNFLPASEVYENYRTIKSVDFSHVNVSKEEPLGGVTHDMFVYGSLHPGGTGSVKKHKKKGKNEPVDEETEEIRKEEAEPQPAADHTV